MFSCGSFSIFAKYRQCESQLIVEVYFMSKRVLKLAGLFMFSAIPGDVAYFGTVGPWTMMISSLFGGMIVMLLIPIFYKMKLNSVYEVRKDK